MVRLLDKGFASPISTDLNKLTVALTAKMADATFSSSFAGNHDLVLTGFGLDP
jgi:hypothetical protein